MSVPAKVDKLLQLARLAIADSRRRAETCLRGMHNNDDRLICAVNL